MANTSIYRDTIAGSVLMASSASTSAGVDTRGYPIVGIHLPTMSSGTVSFQHAPDPGTGVAPAAASYVDIHKTDGTGKFTMAAGTSNLAISLHDILAGMQWIRVVSSVVQTAARTIKYTLKG